MVMVFGLLDETMTPQTNFVQFGGNEVTPNITRTNPDSLNKYHLGKSQNLGNRVLVFWEEAGP